MTDATHQFFADPERLAGSMADERRNYSGDELPFGGFIGSPGRLTGHVYLEGDGIVGVWCDWDKSAKSATRVVFFRVVDGEAIVNEFHDVAWSESEIVVHAARWFDSSGA